MNPEEIPKHLLEDLKKKEAFENLKKSIEDDLNTNPKYKEFYSRYTESSIKDFINHYSYLKASLITYGDMYAGIEERALLKYSDKAAEIIWEIQQKKLFDLQCQWRAESITIPGIETTSDFDYWERKIKECPFIPAITPEELELYQEFVLSDNFDTDPWNPVDWQDYDTFKLEHDDNRHSNIELPDWYDFHNGRTGAGLFLSLPDVRGKKEEFYIDIWLHDEKMRHPEQYNYKSPPPDNRLVYYYNHKKTIERFVMTCESDEVKEYYELMTDHNEQEYYHYRDQTDDDLVEELRILNLAGNIDLIYHHDWRRAITLTVQHYEKEQIYNALQVEYKKYLSRIRMSIGFSDDVDSELDDILKQNCSIHKERIIAGRILNGEPADLNF